MNVKSVTSRIALCLLLCAVHLSVLAQISRRDLPPGTVSQPVTNLPPPNVVIEQPAALETEPAASVSTRVDLSDMVATPVPPPDTIVVPAYVPPVVAGYLPARDTNVAIGISYPPGSSDFVYLVAGRPRLDDPRLPRAEPVVVAPPPPPLATYERAEMGSRAILMRHSETALMDEYATRDFPAGTALRRPALAGEGAAAGLVAPNGVRSSADGRIAVSYREATHTASGEEIVRTFPPGARLLRSAPAATPL